ncbi:glycerol-3-phosphate dehydrogenase/oxidase [Pseudorhodoferax sp. LjRoot39]|uniref:glycerol-3-phosphate dehydrogenase/oxidase n=1 Tax=Pseudorhodoferax sp. LjRoot39 TaxID=3342328 RepID=UPI003ECE0FE0
MSSNPSFPQATERAALFAALAAAPAFDIAIVGGGATGLGVAVDAASRGLRTLLVESHDFAKGTSSRATKLVHGGVRYLAQGNVGLVREALHERTTLLHNAPHLAQPLAFVMPCYALWEGPFYGAGLKAYDLLAGDAGLGSTRFLSRSGVLSALPNIRPQGLKGGVLYWDGQFDDARLALALARTAARHGALAINYCAATGLVHEGGKVVGLTLEDRETGAVHQVRAGCVVNATGVWVDQLRAQDAQALARPVTPIVAPSQGVHAVVDRSFMPTDHALLVPKTADGRVLFAVPWLGKLILGTTDTPRQDLPYEPRPFAEELDFILRESARYLARPPMRSDILSCWVGLRPLVKPSGDDAATKKISREHTVQVSASGLVTVTGGKWTTYRAMAEDVLQQCYARRLLPGEASCRTQRLRLVGADDRLPRDRPPMSAPQGSQGYGSDWQAVSATPGSERMLGSGVSEAMVRFAARHEYARTVEDVLARRVRMLFLDARQAAMLAQPVAEILQDEGCPAPEPVAFQALAQSYLPDAGA